jgi:TPR repeat protein
MDTLRLKNGTRRPVAPYLIVALLATCPAHAAQGARSDQAGKLIAQALAYEHGEGVARDPQRASELYCKAARLGDAEAMHALGWMYANGRGLPRNDAYAGTLFAMAAFLGNVHARRMTRFTGGYTGQVPDCLHPSPTLRVDASWNPEAHIRSLSADRQAVARLVVELAANYDIAPRLALAIAITESSLNPVAVSPRNAMGVMQLIPGTAARFNVRNPFDARENIKGGLAYLRWLLAYFRGDIALAAAGYNAGEGAVDRYRGVPPYRETQAYVERILSFVGSAEHPFDSRITAPSSVLSGIRAVREAGSH